MKEKIRDYYTNLEQLFEDLAKDIVNDTIDLAYYRNIVKRTINAGYDFTRVNGPVPGPETNPLVIDMEQTFKKCLSLVKKKNNDYSGQKTVDHDPFKNIRGAEFVGVSNEKGILVRMMDKMGRISSLLGQKANVKDEAIEDTLDDLINYAAILKSYLKRKNKIGN